MRYFFKFPNQIFFKKRYNKYKQLNNLKFGNVGLFFIKKFRFEYIYFIFFKNLIKLLNKNKYKFIKNFYFWFFLSGNYPISKKSKNSRMGKGKGIFLRWSIMILNNFFFLEFLIYKFFFIFFKKYFFNNFLKFYIS